MTNHKIKSKRADFDFFFKLYLTEIPPINLRGLTGTLTQLSVVVGILLSNIFGLKEIFGLLFFLILNQLLAIKRYILKFF
jgi:hypothetical protein